MPSEETGKGNDMQSPLFKEFTPSDREQWRVAVDRLLKGAPYEKRMRRKTLEGITLEAIYRAEDIDAIPHLGTLPGHAPFVRGSRPIHNDHTPWIVAQEAGACSLEATRAQVKDEIARGSDAVHLKLDAASCMGQDPGASDSISADREGASISCLPDLAFVLDGLDLSEKPVFIQCKSSGLAYLGFLAALAEQRKMTASALRGAVAMDPLCALAEEGALPLSMQTAYDEMGAMTTWVQKHAPDMRTLWVHGETWHDGGGDAVQELAFSLATMVEYMRAMETRGHDFEACADSMVLSFSLGTHFFMEVAKLRAARILLHNIFDACGKPESAGHVRIHTSTSRFTMTRNDPHVNLLRATTQTMSGVIGGTDSLHVAPFDETLGTSDGFSRRIARNIQLVVKDEAHLADSMDPAGGSWFVEHLTSELAEKAWRLFQEVEAKGGMFAALEDGFPQEYITDTKNVRDMELAKRKRILVGTNQYPNAMESIPETNENEAASMHSARNKEVADMKASRKGDVDAALSKIEASSPDDRMQCVITAAGENATVAEICAALPSRKNGVAAKIAVPLKAMRAAEPFERLRASVEAHFDGPDRKPEVFLATLGPVSRYMPRLDFAASFFETGGFRVMRTAGFDTPDDAAQQALLSNAKIAVICGLDEDYAASAEQVARMIKKVNPTTQVVLAGRPGPEDEARFKEAGIDLFIHAGADLLKILTRVAEAVEVQL